MKTNHLIAIGGIVVLVLVVVFIPKIISEAAYDKPAQEEQAASAANAEAKKVASNDPFPHRPKYQGLNFVSTEELKNIYDSAVIVDVRTELEYNVLHIAKAKRVTLSDDAFLSNLEKVRSKKDIAQPIVFYCNGHTCAKSYKAGKKATEAGFENIIVYDSGVFDWVKANPTLGTLLGETPVNTNEIISKADFKSHMLDYDTFKNMSTEGDSIVIDIRDSFQRKVFADFDNMIMMPLSDIPPLLKRKMYRDKKVMLVDAVGKQVRWLQYHLERHGYKDYYFLEGGMDKVAKTKTANL